MRESKKKVINHQENGLAAYHTGTRNGGYNADNENCGFKQLSFFASDRKHAVLPGMLPSEKMAARGLQAKGFGLEIEMRIPAIRDKDVAAAIARNYILAEFDDDLFKIESDVTVDIECITQVMSAEYIRNHYAEFHQLYKRLKICGGSCADSGDCGMHTNISLACFGRERETQVKNANKLWALFSRPDFDELLAQATCRRLDRRTWCNRIPREINYRNDHSQALNFAHIGEGAGRIEIRLVGGQPDFQAFRSTMETIFFLVKRIKTISNPEKISIEEFFSGCNKYVYAAIFPYLTAEQDAAISEKMDRETDYTLHDGR